VTVRSRIDSGHGKLAVLGLVMLSACGGGESLSTGSPPTPPPNLSSLQVTGGFVHNNTVLVTGTQFGTKVPAAPVVWDDASGTSIFDKWDGAWPDLNPTYDTEYRAPQRGIGLPHANITSYIAGAHYGSGGANAGYNVIFWKNRTISSYPAFSYMSWYQRIDDAWVFQDNLTPDTDNNIKMSAFSVCCSPYELPNNWYVEYNPRPTSPSSSCTWHLNDDGFSLEFPDQNGHNWFWGPCINPMSGVWIKIEQEIKYSRQSDGYIKLWENGVLKVNYAGATDLYSGNERSEGIGGYARSRSTANWRYFADVYLDYEPGRVVLANNSRLDLATIRENQIPLTWSDTSITFSVNLGRFTAGQTAYLFVVNTSGQATNPGFPLIVP
jgi:hypothetical protein